jgi:hypothetical protein
MLQRLSHLRRVWIWPVKQYCSAAADGRRAVPLLCSTVICWHFIMCTARLRIGRTQLLSADAAFEITFLLALFVINLLGEMKWQKLAALHVGVSIRSLAAGNIICSVKH